jgi:hypothetical protein
MNSNMASSAVSVPWVSHVVRRRLGRYAVGLAAETSGAIVAFQADREDDGPLQKAGVYRAMGRMAAFTSVNTHRGVLVEKGTAFIDVALHTRLLIVQSRIHKMRASPHLPSSRVRTMRIMAIRTRHKAFVDPMFGGE